MDLDGAWAVGPDASQLGLVPYVEGGRGCSRVDLDGGWSVVADAGGFISLLEPITVVVLAFHCSWAGSVAAGGDRHSPDLGENDR